MGPTSRSISDTEMEVLKALWQSGPGTVRDVDAVLRAGGRDWAYTTVLTLLQRLEAKGHVRIDKRGVPHVFHAAITREGLLRRRLKDLAEELTEGTATPLVQALVTTNRFTEAEIDQLRRLLDAAEAKERRRRRGPRRGERR